MEGWIKSVVAFFSPPDPPISDFFPVSDMAKAEKHMKAVRGWCVKVSLALIALTGASVVAITPWGFVLASDLQGKIDVAVKDAVKDLKAEQAVIKADVAEIKVQNIQMATGLRELLRSQTSTNICRLVVRWLNEPDRAEKARLRVDADTEQNKYKVLDGEYYPESRCGSGP